MIYAPFTAGPDDARICFIGQAPGTHEAAHGGAFTGPAGKELTKFCANAGVNRTECKLENLFQFFPPNDDLDPFIKLGTKHVTKTPIYDEHAEALRSRLLRTSANILIPMGNISMYALTGIVGGVTKWRGSILESTMLPGRKVMPTIHPSAILKTRDTLSGYLVTYDLIRAKKESDYPEIRLRNRQLNVQPTMPEIKWFLEECRRRDEIAYDIETRGKHLSHISFATDPDHAICIPFVSGSQDIWSPEEEAEILLYIAELLEDTSVTKIGQNLSFDCTFMYRRFGISVAPVHDTMIAAGIIFPDFPKGLHHLVANYCDGEPYYKDDGKEWMRNPFESDLVFRRYNAMDSAVLMEIWPKQRTELERTNNWNAYIDQKELIHPLVYAGDRGIPVDIDTMKALRDDCDKEITTIDAALHAIMGEQINLDSNQQLINYFYIMKGIKPYVKRRKKGPSTPTVDETAMKRLASRGIPEAQLIVQRRKLVKLKGTYFETVLDDDNRFRCSYNPGGTVQARISSSKTIWGTGCVSGDTEVLTKNGWQTIETFDPTTSEAMTWNATNNTLSFEQVDKIVTPIQSIMVSVESTHHKMLYTSDHRIPTITSKGHCDVKLASELFNYSEVTIPAGATYYDGIIDHAAIDPRLYAAFIADGSINNNKIRFSFSKERKIERFISLFPNAIEQKPQRPDSNKPLRRFSIAGPQAGMCIEMGKTLGPWVLSMTQEWLSDFLDESKHWDATIRGRSFWFFTTIPENAEWLATIAHVTNNSATININEDNNNGYGSGNNKPLYTVNIKPRNYIRNTPSKHCKLRPWMDRAYCLSTKSGGFIARRNSNIICTLNSNLQNQPAAMLRLFHADSGGIFICQDLAQAENRVVAYEAVELKMIRALEEGVDIHSLTGSLLHGVPIEQCTPEMRQDGKTTNHGLNYGYGVDEFILRYELEREHGKRLHAGYHQVYPGIEEWHATIKNELTKNGRILVNCWGRQRKFLDDWGKPGFFEKAYNYKPQSAVANKVNKHGVRYLYERQDLFPEVEFVNTVHDSVWYWIPLSVGYLRIMEIIKLMKDNLETPLTIKGRQVSLPVDTQIGFSLDKNKMLELKADKTDFSSLAALADELEVYVRATT